jgi:hypothetical protein
MYARFWWKDARQFWPTWVILAVAAAIVQGLLLYYVGQDARHGALGLSALGCTTLYAVATSAAAFASEREVGTLRLLDIVPVDRWVVWASKVSFALLTTLVLLLVLMTMAMVSTDSWSPHGPIFGAALSYGMIVLVALGWGLFWSAVLSNALNAAVAAICCTGVSLSLILYLLSNVYSNRDEPLLVAISQLCLFLVTLIASVVIFVRVIDWRWLQLEFRSPIVVHLAKSTSATPQESVLRRSLVSTVLMQRSVAINEALVTARPTRRSWLVEVRALTWQTVKEGRKTWFLLATIGFVALGHVAMGLIIPSWRLSPSLEGLVLLSIGVSLVAGTSVFGLENRARTYRFLTHHGARPGLVWLARVMVWSVETCVICALGLAAIWGSLALTDETARRQIPAVSIQNGLSGILMIPLYFGIALLCGMAIRRSITAVVIALVIGLGLTFPLVSLVATHMLPMQGLLVIPMGLLGVSWAWTSDWLLDRPAPARWVHLGMLITGTLTLAMSWYVGYRAWSIRDVGAIPPPATQIDVSSTPLAAEQNAAEVFRTAGNELIGPVTESPDFLDRNRQVLDLIHLAAKRPGCRFAQAEKPTLIDQPNLPPVAQLVMLLTLDASERQKRDDLDGAWHDIMVIFSIARHIGEGMSLYPGLSMIGVERYGLGSAMAWTVAPGQTPQRLQTALAAYHRLPEMPASADIIRAEANIDENTLDLPSSKIRNWLYESMYGVRPEDRILAFAAVDMLTMPWERIRVRRVNRLISKALVEAVLREPWQRAKQADPEIEHAQMTTYLAMKLIPNPGAYIQGNDRNEVARRVLVQMLALRVWQLKHGGQFPQSLDALIPEELSTFPNDPYSGRLFGYIRSQGQMVAPARFALFASPEKGQASTPGSWLLYSVGPDGHDDAGTAYGARTQRPQPMDFVFEIPRVQPNTGMSKEPDRGPHAGKDRPAPTTSPPSSGRPGLLRRRFQNRKVPTRHPRTANIGW